MLSLITLVIAVSTYEIYGMVKRGQKREILVFVILAVLALGLGLYYTSNPYKDSLTLEIHRLIGKDF